MSGKTAILFNRISKNMLDRYWSDEELLSLLPPEAVQINLCWVKNYDKDLNLVLHERGYTYWLDSGKIKS